MSIITRKNEIRFTTRDLMVARNMFLAEPAFREWQVEFFDEKTGEKVMLPRKDMIANTGTLIEGDLGSKLLFFIETGELKEVTVSNQRREAYEIKNAYLFPWMAKIKIDDKPKKIMLYAAHLQMALDILKDYVELEFTKGFKVVQIGELSNAILLKDTLRSPGEELAESDAIQDLKFFQIDVKVNNGEFEYSSSFVVETKDIDKGMSVIHAFVAENGKDKGIEPEMISLKLEQAKPLSCDIFIDREFSFAYSKDSE